MKHRCFDRTTDGFVVCGGAASPGPKPVKAEQLAKLHPCKSFYINIYMIGTNTWPRLNCNINVNIIPP